MKFLYKFFFKIEVLVCLIIFSFCVYLYCKFKKKEFNLERFLETIINDVVPLQDINSKLDTSAPDASGNKKVFIHEEKCRDVLEKIFNVSFPKVRPEWLVNPATGRNLELDGFCPYIITPIGMGLAFERDGEFHSIKDHPFNYNQKGQNTYLDQSYRDNMKTAICMQRKIVLIRIPHTIKMDDIESFIRNKLELYKVNISENLQYLENSKLSKK